MENRATYGLSLCVGGQLTYTMRGKTYVSHPGNAVLLPQGGTYSIFGDKEGLFPLINFKCEQFPCDTIALLPLENPQRCIKLFETLKSLFLHEENHLNIYSTFYELLSNVSYTNPKKHNPLESVVQYIEENLTDPELSNDALAQKMGISEVYLRKLFVSHYTVTPRQYVLDVRIRHAKQLLCDTSYTVSTIAEKSGFSSVYHFCRTFKQRTGQTPTQYASANRVYDI